MRVLIWSRYSTNAHSSENLMTADMCSSVSLPNPVSWADIFERGLPQPTSSMGNQEQWLAEVGGPRRRRRAWQAPKVAPRPNQSTGFQKGSQQNFGFIRGDQCMIKFSNLGTDKFEKYGKNNISRSARVAANDEGSLLDQLSTYRALSGAARDSAPDCAASMCKTVARMCIYSHNLHTTPALCS